MAAIISHVRGKRSPRWPRRKLVHLQSTEESVEELRPELRRIAPSCAAAHPLMSLSGSSFIADEMVVGRVAAEEAERRLAVELVPPVGLRGSGEGERRRQRAAWIASRVERAVARRGAHVDPRLLAVALRREEAQRDGAPRLRRRSSRGASRAPLPSSPRSCRSHLLGEIAPRLVARRRREARVRLRQRLLRPPRELLVRRATARCQTGNRRRTKLNRSLPERPSVNCRSSWRRAIHAFIAAMYSDVAAPRRARGCPASERPASRAGPSSSRATRRRAVGAAQPAAGQVCPCGSCGLFASRALQRHQLPSRDGVAGGGERRPSSRHEQARGGSTRGHRRIPR